MANRSCSDSVRAPDLEVAGPCGRSEHVAQEPGGRERGVGEAIEGGSCRRLEHLFTGGAVAVDQVLVLGEELHGVLGAQRLGDPRDRHRPGELEQGGEAAGVDRDDAVDLASPRLRVELGEHLGGRGPVQREGDVLEEVLRVEAAPPAEVVLRAADRAHPRGNGVDQLLDAARPHEVDVAVDRLELGEAPDEAAGASELGRRDEGHQVVAVPLAAEQRRHHGEDLVGQLGVVAGVGHLGGELVEAGLEGGEEPAGPDLVERLLGAGEGVQHARGARLEGRDLRQVEAALVAELVVVDLHEVVGGLGDRQGLVDRHPHRADLLGEAGHHVGRGGGCAQLPLGAVEGVLGGGERPCGRLRRRRGAPPPARRAALVPASTSFRAPDPAPADDADGQPGRGSRPATRAPPRIRRGRRRRFPLPEAIRITTTRIPATRDTMVVVLRGYHSTALTSAPDTTAPLARDRRRNRRVGDRRRPAPPAPARATPRERPRRRWHR